MPLLVYTTRLGAVRDFSDVVDITRQHVTAPGQTPHFLAPSWDILRDVLAARKQAREVLALAKKIHPDDTESDPRDLYDEADRLEINAWIAYEPLYLAELRESYRRDRPQWNAFLAKKRVVLGCVCAKRERCHRVLAARVLGLCGADVRGELGEQMRLI